MFRIQIYNDPNDSHSKLGVESLEELLIPMKMEGSTCSLVTYRPTDGEIQECQRIIPSDEFDWYPSKNLFKISSMEEEYRTSSSFHRYTNIVEIRFLCAPTTIQCRDD